MRRRRLPLWLLTFLLCAPLTLAPAVITASAGCGKSALLQDTLTGLDVARVAFTRFDRDHQQRIVAEAKTLEEGTQKLRAYRLVREKVVLAFELAYRLIATAALEPEDFKIEIAIQAALDVHRIFQQLAQPEPPTSAPTKGGP